jgi:peptidoglycan/xylan/chitin deacetylase (PgdA/CDA1 family)
MAARRLLKTALSVAGRYVGMDGLLAFRYAGAGTIFSLHSVVDSTDSRPDEHLRCPGATLERVLCWLKANGIEVVSLDEGIARLAECRKEKFCVFTFDDGYADNLSRALPLMERFNAPFTVYVTTGWVTGALNAWWLGLGALVTTHQFVELPELACRFDCLDQIAKKRAFIAIADLVTSSGVALNAVTRAIARADIDCGALSRKEALNTEQLRQLAASPLVTIGAHGVRHINLAQACKTDAEEEMILSRRFLEEIIDRDVVHFSYPFGGCGQRETQLAHSAGFRTAVTTQHGTLFPEHLKHLYALPREPIFRGDDGSALRLKLNGSYRAWHSRLGDPVAHL